MEALVLYSLKAAGVTTVFYLLWRVLLRKETLHRLNRVILVLTPVLSMILPLCVITIRKTVPGPGPEANAAAGALEEVSIHDTNLWTIIGVIYLAGVALALLRIAWSTIRLSMLLKEGEKHILEDGSTLVITEKNLPPFSWMGHIVMSRKDYESGNQEIILHEQAHIHLLHSMDIMRTDLLAAFQWYNPFIWALGADLRGIHEYEADEYVIKEGTNPTEYQLFLINRAALVNGLSPVSSLQSGTIKGRIEMMLKNRTDWKAGLKALYIIPVIVLTLIACSKTVTEYEDPTPVAEEAELIPFQLVDEENPIPLQLVERKPTFNGGDANEFSKWVNTRLNYPQEAKDLNIQGKVVLQFTVAKTGNVKDVRVLRGIDPLLDKEAVRVVSASPKWAPGFRNEKRVDVTYTFPVIFQLR